MDYDYDAQPYYFPPKQQSTHIANNSPVKTERYYNSNNNNSGNWLSQQQTITVHRPYRALTILSPTGSTSSSFSSSCSTPNSASGTGGDDNDSSGRRKIRPAAAVKYAGHNYGNTSVKDYIKNKNSGHYNISEYIDDHLEDLEASRSLLREMVAYPAGDHDGYSVESRSDEMAHKSGAYVVRVTAGTASSYHQNQATGRYSVDSHDYAKMPKTVGMPGGMTQNTTPSTSSPFTTQNSGATVSAPSSSSYRIRERYSSNANASSYGSGAELYGSGADLSTGGVYHQSDYRNSAKGDSSAAYMDDYDDGGGGGTPYGGAGMLGPGSVAALSQSGSDSTCAVCGDGHAKLHYGVLACYGCKGFFRRTLTGKYRYACRFGNNCIVDKYQRNSCRFCRFNRCLEVGMDPKAVRPDRDLTGKQRVPRARKRQIDEELISHIMRLQGDDWSRKIPVEAKVLLMQLLNIESKVIKGDSCDKDDDVDFDDEDDLKLMRLRSRRQHMSDGSEHNTAPGDAAKSVSLRELFEQKPTLHGRRTEMCFEPYRMARPEELSLIAHRSALAAVDWIDSLAEIGDFCAETEDKVALAKGCYAPLTIFNLSARTVQNTKDPDILCLNNHCYVPRKLPPEFNSTTHLSNVLIDRILNELVATLRKLNLREEEVVPLKSIIILNPNCKGLSVEAQHRVAELRDRIQDMLFQIVKELHPTYNPSSRFGNLLLILPTITTLSGVMNENMQFTQVFGSSTGNEPLLSELFEDSRKTSSPGGTDEPLITSSTSGLTPPLFENPADISLQPKAVTSCMDTFSKTPIGTRNMPNGAVSQKIDECTQTDLHLSSVPNTLHQGSDMSSAFCTLHDAFASPSKNQMIDDSLAEVVRLTSFGSSFDDSSLFDDYELADSSTFSPETAAQFFESTNDIFELMK